MALLDPASDDATRLQLLTREAPASDRSLREWLEDLVSDAEGQWSEPWLRACAMYAVPSELPGEAATGLVRPFLDDPDADVAETARWVTERWVAPRQPHLDVPGQRRPQAGARKGPTAPG